MKTILKIIAILLVASVVAGGFSLVINNTSNTSSLAGGGQPPAMISADGQSTGPMARPEGVGNEGGASISGGLSGILVTLIKLTGITAIVLLIEKVYGMLSNRKLSPAR